MDRSVTDASSALPETGGSEEKRLARIAELLGCPVEALTDGAAFDGDASDASELLQLWLTITDAQDRRRVLSLARTLAQT